MTVTLEFFKALYEQSVDAVQITIETVAAMGGELGELMQAMRAKGPEWVQGLIEMCRESEILQKIFASVGALFACLPPNLWAEGIGVGYIVPELLISVVLAVLAAISAGAGAAALAARLLGYGARLRKALSQHGRLGRVLLAIYDGIGNLADNIAALVRALWRNISETVEGAVDRTNRITRAARAARTGRFTPLGLRADPTKTSEGRAMMHELAKEAPDADFETIYDRAQANMLTGESLPEIRQAAPGEKLYKAVPHGSSVGDHSPFFATRDELDKITGGPSQLVDKLALPKASESVAYDIYSVQPKPGSTPSIFSSKVAPTVEGTTRRRGGAIQSLIPYRGDWTTPTHEFTIGK